jgi:chemotaxis protein MotB
MFTFSDLVTLLLTFFVMLLSMKAPEIQKLKAVFGVFSQGSASSLGMADREQAANFKRLLDAIRQPRADEFSSEAQKLARELELPPEVSGALGGSLQPGVKLKNEERGVVITLANDLLFPAGRSRLTPEAKKAIGQAAGMLRYSSQPVAIEGHTDNLPPGPGAAAPDNWDLSLQRALAVLHYLVEQENLPRERFRVAALGPTRPLAPNDTPAHRAMNRRTEIVLMLEHQ